MFNRSPFNRGKFNTSQNQQVSGHAAIRLITQSTGGTLTMFAVPSSARLVIGVKGHQSGDLFAPMSVAAVAFLADGGGVREHFAPDTEAGFVFDAYGSETLEMFAAETTAEIVLHSDGEPSRDLFAALMHALVVLGANGAASRSVFADAPPVSIVLDASGAGTREFRAVASNALALIHASGSATLYGYALIDLPGLALPPGGELIIDTGAMTVTLNGVDVTRYFSPESEFFKLRPGDNLIVYEDGAVNRNIDYKILWKDLWL